MFGYSLGRSDEFEGQGDWSNVKVTRNKNEIFRPFLRPACGLCLVKKSLGSSLKHNYVFINFPTMTKNSMTVATSVGYAAENGQNRRERGAGPIYIDVPRALT